MHIPDAVLDPKVAMATGGLAVAGMFVGLRKLEQHLGERTTVLLGTMSAFIFAAQMVKFPVGPGVSGHLLGGVLSAVMLGPWAGLVVIGAVLIVQCLLFGDGGLTALGANFVNMGLIGSVAGYAIYAPIRRVIGGRPGVLIGGMVAAWFSVLLASGAFAIELAASGRRADFFQVLSWMALVHAGIGLGEALITGLVLRFVLLTRPDLVYLPELLALDAAPAGADGSRWGQITLAGLVIALAVGVFVAPFASEHPDGLEYVGAKLGFLKNEAKALVPAVIPDYQLPVFGAGQVKLATALAGLVGTLVVFGVGLGMARIFSGAARKGFRRMRLEFLERYCEGAGPLHRLDARLKLVAALAFVVLVVATPVGWWRPLAAEALVLAFVVGLSGVPPRELLARWLGFFMLVGFLGLMVAPSHPRRAELGVGVVLLTILAKNSLAFMAMLILVNVTPFRKLLIAMRRLGMPLVLVATLQFMYRYLHVLTDELDRMVKARRSRTFRRSGRLDWGLLTNLIGVLFVRAFERGERVHAAMIARGWDGTIRTLDTVETKSP